MAAHHRPARADARPFRYEGMHVRFKGDSSKRFMGLVFLFSVNSADKKDKLCRLETLGIEIILLTSQVSYEGMYKSEYQNK